MHCFGIPRHTQPMMVDVHENISIGCDILGIPVKHCIIWECCKDDSSHY